MKEDPHIFHDEPEGIGIRSRTAKEQGRSPAEGRKSLEQGGNLPGLLQNGRAVLLLQSLRTVKETQDIIKNLKIGRNDRFFFLFCVQIKGKDDQKRDQTESRVQEHQAEGGKRRRGGYIVGKVSALPQSCRKVDVIVE